MRRLREFVELVATHSPLLKAAYDELDVVALWRNFHDAPQRFLRHLRFDS